MSIPKNSQKPNFGANEGVWEYKTIDGEVICYTVRTINKQTQKKQIHPWTYQDGMWQPGGISGLKKRPIYGLEQLKIHPAKPVLIVEGEKTAAAGKTLLPDFNSLTWLGGCTTVDKVDWSVLKGKTVYLLPDNDENGYKAMEWLLEGLRDIAAQVHFVDIQKLRLAAKWDIADLYDDHGEIEPDDVISFIRDAPVHVYKPKIIPHESFPDLSDKGRPLNTSENIMHLLSSHSIEVRHNLMTNYPEFKWHDATFSATNEADCFLTEISNMCVRNGVPKMDLPAHLIYISDKSRYHPAQDFIESKPWDGVSRIQSLLDTIETPKKDLSDRLIYRWLLSCVAALYLPNGIASEGALVFQGAQKVGKTYWLLKLMPEPYRHLVKEGVSVNVDNKDDIMQATNIWIAELGEIASTFKKSDIDSLKNFITRSIDEYRVPFGRFSRRLPRRTIFYGSVNAQYFLADDTGNRRFWVVPVTKIDYEHTIDMQQLWAEIKVHFDRGESYRLTGDEQNMLNDSNRDHEQTDPIEEMILSKYQWDIPNRRRMTLPDILTELSLPIDKAKRNALANILRKLKIPISRSSSGMVAYIPYININQNRP